MTNEEILEAAKEAGAIFDHGSWILKAEFYDDSDLLKFAAIIERRTIERCAIAAVRNGAWKEYK